ncbi:hypothetical protein AAFC00_000294 [Neodothiora populina]|uniref:Pre-mRNA-splicing factor 38B n=1 Tax=Neodothiora populina TaxID=2781224 RepID=A0ABR3PCE9_9PEZI
MPGDDYSDDFVAELLKRNAKANSSAATNLGLGSLSSKRPNGSAALKPNTRFLKNLIRDTDTHNAALLAREAEESRARLNKLREQERVQRRAAANNKARPEQRLYSARARYDGTGPAMPPPTKRRRVSEDEVEESKTKRKHPSSRHDDETDTKRSHRRRSRSRSPESVSRRSGHQTKRRTRERSRSRTSSPVDRDRHRGHRHHHHHHHHHRNSHSDRSESQERSKTTRRTTRSSASPEASKSHRRRHSPASDSDPLEAILGPAPPPPIRSKGRGTLNSSTIDTHFSSNYDPTQDQDPDDVDLDGIAGDDWDNALEALRDRNKWRQQGADRLRAAGFTDEEVRKWSSQKVDPTTGERVMDDADVRWNKAGEGREWDRGKVMDQDEGTVSVAPEWGRLRGT